MVVDMVLESYMSTLTYVISSPLPTYIPCYIFVGPLSLFPFYFNVGHSYFYILYPTPGMISTMDA